MIAPHEIAEELAREAAARRAAYPRQIERMQMTPETARLEQALCAAWSADLARYTPWLTNPQQNPPIAPVARSQGFTWHERRAGLQRELDRRARLYPKWIATGQLVQAEADRRTRRLSAMADLYDEGHDWHDTFGTRPPFGPGMTASDHPEPVAEAIRQWWTHVHNVHHTRHGAPQQEQLAL